MTLCYKHPRRFKLYFNREQVAKEAKDIWNIKVEGRKKLIQTHSVHMFNDQVWTVYMGPKAKQPKAFISGYAREIKVRKSYVVIT